MDKIIKLKGIILAFFLALLLSSCSKKTETVEFAKPYDAYYPIYQGSYFIYDVDSIKWNNFEQRFDTTRYELKEVFDSSFLDNKNEKAYKLYQSLRFKPAQDFSATKLYYVKKTSTYAERVDENIRYIKFKFPIEEGQLWNSNIRNNNDSFGLAKAKILKLHKPKSIGGFSFDSTATIRYFDYEDFLEKHYEEETYAYKIGLIERYVIDTQFIQMKFESKISDGYIFHQRLKEYKLK